MKTQSLLFVALALTAASGCSTPSGMKVDHDSAASGPTVFNSRTDPGTIELNSNLQPNTSAIVLTDIRDNSNVTDVRLRFKHVPIEVPMEHIGGTTWKATLSPRQLQLLAVSGRTMTYDADVIAKDDAGMTATSKDPVQVAVKAPAYQNGSG